MIKSQPGTELYNNDGEKNMKLFDMVVNIMLLLIICGMIFIPIALLELKSERVYKVEVTNLKECK